MKLLFENWRQYLKERIDYYVPPKEQEEIDLGETFTKITIDNIVNNEYTNSKDQANVLVVLDLFDKLYKEQNLFEAKSILKVMRTMSGNSEDFSFLKNYDNPSEVEIKHAKNKAREFYIVPNRLKSQPKDRGATKSLRDWHDHLKVVYSRPSSSGSWQDRSDKIKAFYSSSDYGDYNNDEPDASKAEVDPYGRTIKAPMQVTRKITRY